MQRPLFEAALVHPMRLRHEDSRGDNVFAPCISHRNRGDRQVPDLGSSAHLLAPVLLFLIDRGGLTCAGDGRLAGDQAGQTRDQRGQEKQQAQTRFRSINRMATEGHIVLPCRHVHCQSVHRAIPSIKPRG